MAVSQFEPNQPEAQAQAYQPAPLVHAPLFWHGVDAHSSKSAQAASPAEEACPLGHATHTPALGYLLLAQTTQSVDSSDPAGLTLPLAHEMHAACAAAAL